MAAVESAVQENEDRDRQDMKTRLEVWDDDESDELFYVDRCVLIFARRAVFHIPILLEQNGDESDSELLHANLQTISTPGI